MSAGSLQASGRDAYKRKDYAKALDFFNRAVGRGDASPQLLDNLASTHLKLSDYPAALAAAKKAIQAGRDDPTGYLRAGIVLKTMGRPSVALEIYAYGLKSVRHVGHGYEQLKKVHNELQQELAPTNSVDPLSVLPRELALYVLEYLSFRQRVGICRVSKGWQKFVRSEPNLWKHLDLSGAKAKVKSSFVSVAINAARNTLSAATLNRLYDFEKALTALVRYCPLESLALGDTGMQGDGTARVLESAVKLRHLTILKGTQLSTERLCRILGTRGLFLETIEISSSQSLCLFDHRWPVELPSLLSVDIRTTKSILSVTRHVADLPRKAPKLRHLTLHECEENVPGQARPVGFDLRSCHALEYLDISLVMLDALRRLSLPATLRVLKLASMRWGSGRGNFISLDSVEPYGWSLAELPVLDELELNVPKMEWTDIDTQLSLMPATAADGQRVLSKLKSLSLRQVSIDGARLDFPTRLSELQNLSLRDCQDIGDVHVDCILDQLKHVKKLDLSGSAVTGVAVKSIVKSGHVKELIVNDCRIARDAIDWARAQGLKVDFRMTKLEGDGKRVRY